MNSWWNAQPYRCPGICRMRNIFPTSVCNAIHISQIITLLSNLNSAHYMLIVKPFCLWSEILRKTKGGLDLEHQPWPKCARPLSSQQQPRNFACPCCQDVQRPTQVWAEVITELWVDLGDSGERAVLLLTEKSVCFLVIWLCFFLYLSCCFILVVLTVAFALWEVMLI